MSGKVLVNVVLLIISIGLAAGGQVAMKAGMEKVGEVTMEKLKHPFTLAKDVLKSVWVVIGVSMFVISALFWLIALSRVPLSIAYPMVAGGYVIVVIASLKLFDETLRWFSWIGLVLIVIGVVAIGLGLKTPT